MDTDFDSYNSYDTYEIHIAQNEGDFVIKMIEFCTSVENDVTYEV